MTLLVVAAFVVLHTTSVQAQQKTKRLILKDGFYQSVVKYEVQGTACTTLAPSVMSGRTFPGYVTRSSKERRWASTADR
jgi:hypothetical protein